MTQFERETTLFATLISRISKILQRVFRVFLTTIFRTMDPLFIRISIRKAKCLVTFEKVYSVKFEVSPRDVKSVLNNRLW